MAKYQKYAEYKDSGVEWLGEIPNDWEMWKLSHAYTEIGSGTTPSTSNEENFEGNIPWVTTGELRENLILDTKKKVSQRTIEQFPTLKKYPIGSVAIAMYGATIGRLGIFGIEATTNQACCVMTTSKVLNNKYVFYWLQAFKNEIIQLSSGGGQPNINQEKVASLKISAPFFEDQINIANFLDYETAQIDTLIAKQEKLIELLKEKRQAVISHAVTKGLNSDVAMKDSGVEWLGRVPEHWEILKFDYAINTVSDIDHYMPSSVDVGIPYIMTGDLKDFVSDIDFESCKQVAYSDYQKLSRKIKTTKDDIIFARYATIGTLSYVDIDKEFLVSYSCVTIKSNSNRTTGKYLSYYLKSQAFLQAIQQQINSNTQGNVGVDSLRNVKIILPLLSEQENIIEFLQAELIKMDNLINKAESAIQLMQERRTALISSAVTGKIDVRNWQHPNEAKTELSL
ncbi:restriction endonuclease subunit S [Acinetobacter sp. YH01008]|uniref:restriction endonuclease subunit S n=1 Tax=Acinetobacter sp. YH01008 TaxID=2601024 RepID=UPI0015D0EA25|nr:restriction endonuclease subunit S [Acinetobacter sp. YH01008]